MFKAKSDVFIKFIYCSEKLCVVADAPWDQVPVVPHERGKPHRPPSRGPPCIASILPLPFVFSSRGFDHVDYWLAHL